MIAVVAGLLRDRKGRVLVSQRLAGTHLEGLWEFPGGKIEADESVSAALERELAEELGIRVIHSQPLLSVTHHYPERSVHLMLREVSQFANEPVGCEGQPLQWVRPQELADLAMPAADRPIARVLGLDPYYVITPDPADSGGLEAVLDRTRHCLQAGFGLLQFRAPRLAVDQFQAAADQFARLAAQFGARWLLNGCPEAATRAGADGVHLSARRLLALKSRPLPADQLVAASCHNERELEQAGQIGVDFVTLSPVRRTSSHPGAGELGWRHFDHMCRCSPAPVFALGGVGPDDLPTAREHGAFGVAGISAFGGR